jgi:thiamine biosynthesis protein ThiS
MMRITLNGEPREVEGPVTVDALLEALDVNPRQVAVALNGEVVTRSRWQQVTVRDGDAVEIVRAVGGG